MSCEDLQEDGGRFLQAFGRIDIEFVDIEVGDCGRLWLRGLYLGFWLGRRRIACALIRGFPGEFVELPAVGLFLDGFGTSFDSVAFSFKDDFAELVRGEPLAGVDQVFDNGGTLNAHR